MIATLRRLAGPLACALAAAFAFGPASAQSASSNFYAYTAAEAVGPPGTLIRAEPLPGAPLGANAWRVLYRSVGLTGEPIAVSGVVIVPAGELPAGGRPVVAWAHPTTGIVPRCAPSLSFFVFQTMAGMRDLVAKGYIVTATDYPGLGTAGPHPYLVGISAGRSVLDAVRVAQQVPGASGGSTGSAPRRFAVWGHSQGGHAALYTGLLAGAYAPELQLEGVAAASPATDLETLMRDDFDSPGGRNLTAMTLWSWSRVFGVPIGQVVFPAAMPTVDALADECLDSVYDVLMRRFSQGPLAREFLSVKDVTTVEPWHSLLVQNIPGTLPSATPVFLAQGEADTLVLPAVTQAYMRKLCAAGSRVRMLSMPGVGHGFAGYESAAAAVAWIADRFDGRAAPDDCKPRQAASNSQ